MKAVDHFEDISTDVNFITHLLFNRQSYVWGDSDEYIIIMFTLRWRLHKHDVKFRVLFVLIRGDVLVLAKYDFSELILTFKFLNL